MRDVSDKTLKRAAERRRKEARDYAIAMGKGKAAGKGKKGKAAGKGDDKGKAAGKGYDKGNGKGKAEKGKAAGKGKDEAEKGKAAGKGDDMDSDTDQDEEAFMAEVIATAPWHEQDAYASDIYINTYVFVYICTSAYLYVLYICNRIPICFHI